MAMLIRDFIVAVFAGQNTGIFFIRRLRVSKKMSFAPVVSGMCGFAMNGIFSIYRLAAWGSDQKKSERLAPLAFCNDAQFQSLYGRLRFL